MQNISSAAVFAERAIVASKPDSRFGSFTLDTTMVLFFLAMETVRTPLAFDAETLVSLLTLAAFGMLPYFLPLTKETGGFAKWLLGRALVASSGGIFGFMFSQSIGTLLPEEFRFVPMTLLIVAAIICCNIQIYGILKIRLAR